MINIRGLLMAFSLLAILSVLILSKPSSDEQASLVSDHDIPIASLELHGTASLKEKEDKDLENIIGQEIANKEDKSELDKSERTTKVKINLKRQKKFSSVKLVSNTNIQNIKFFSKQVFERDIPHSEKDYLPTGTQFVGKLMSAIDTRSSTQVVRILVTSGGAFKGQRIIPKNTVLMANVNYPGDGEMVFLEAFKAIFPNGKEFDLKAQILNSEHFSPGIAGEYHGTSKMEFLATTGLSVATGASDVLQDKLVAKTEDGVTIITNPSIKNALLNGASQASQDQAQRMAEKMRGDKPYVTITDGDAVIVSLLQPFQKTD